jgi:hypothetical protein
VQRLATFTWRSSPPASIEEELVLFDDGSARLLVLRPRDGGPAIGIYACRPAAADAAALAAAGDGPTAFDLLEPLTDPGLRSLMAAADRVAVAARSEPLAVATFYGRPIAPVADDRLQMSLLVVASGTTRVDFELDMAASAVLFAEGGRPAGWHDLPELPVGFVTREAKGLGGVRRRAEVDPGAFGALAFEVAVPARTHSVTVQVGGWLYDGLPDEPEPRRFEIRTADAEIAR